LARSLSLSLSLARSKKLRAMSRGSGRVAKLSPDQVDLLRDVLKQHPALAVEEALEALSEGGRDIAAARGGAALPRFCPGARSGSSSGSPPVECISEEILVKKLLLIGTAVLLMATSASAQSSGPGMGLYSGIARHSRRRLRRTSQAKCNATWRYGSRGGRRLQS